MRVSGPNPPEATWQRASPGSSDSSSSNEDMLEGMSAVFESLGRALICLDRDFRVVHASHSLDTMIGAEVSNRVSSLKAQELFGADLFGSAGSMRRALLAGDRREGWGATFQIEGVKPRLVSISAAPLLHHPNRGCDPRVAYLVVMRSSEEPDEGGGSKPTIFSGLVARSHSMLRIFHLVEQLSESDATVLITGASGTGKELVARAVHLHSPRSQGSFVAVNCGALPGDLLESELFGHVRGAFTGAVRDRGGRFELAAGGTIFLDEVADMPLHLQVKLLRVLQEKTFERVGESRTRTADVRIIAATNRDLRNDIVEGRFREDLYYRLRVVPIEIPPLRDRREDIEPLAQHLLTRISDRYGRSLRLAPDTLRPLLSHSWPGNVREMENALEYAVAISTGQTIHASQLPIEFQDTVDVNEPIARAPSTEPRLQAVDERLQDEKERLEAALVARQWRRSLAAKDLGMSRTTLWRKMREHGLLE